MFKKKDARAARAAGKVGGTSRMAALSHRERAKLGAKGGAARAKNLSAAERKRIAKRAVKAREARRKERRKNQ